MSLDDLPDALLLKILLLLPLVERTRSASLVSRRFARLLLSEPCAWAELSFDGANSSGLSDEVVLDLCRRAAGLLTRLDVSAQSCDGAVPLLHGEPGTGRSFLEELADEKLTGSLRSLVTWGKDWWEPERLWNLRERRLVFTGEEQAAAFAAACPRLSSAAVVVEAQIGDAVGILRALPRAGAKAVFAEVAEGCWAAAAGSICDVLESSEVESLALLDGGSSLPESYRSPDEAASRQHLAAVERTAQAIASPAHGPVMLAVALDDFGESLLFGPLCRALASSGASCRLRRLDLVTSGLTGPSAAALGAVLASGLPLEYLDVSSNDPFAEEDGGVSFFAALGDSRLRTLRMQDLYLGDTTEAGAALASSIQRSRSLTDLDMSEVSCDGEGWTSVVISALGGNGAGGGLERLNISRWPFGADDARALRASFARGSRLSELCARHCRTGPFLAVGIADGLAAAGATACLRVVDLLESRTGPAGAKAIGRALALPSCPIEQLFLGDCKLIAKGLERGAATSRLVRLDLQTNSLGDGTAKALGAALAALGPAGQLRHLCLAHNQIGAFGLKILCTGLAPGSCPLEELNLSHNPLTDKYGGIAALGAALGAAVPPGTRGLRTAGLAHTRILTSGVLQLLRHGLRRNQTLTSLDVSSNSLTDEGLVALVRWAAEDRFPELTGPGGGDRGEAARRLRERPKLRIAAGGNEGVPASTGVTRLGKEVAKALETRVAALLGTKRMLEFCFDSTGGD